MKIAEVATQPVVSLEEFARTVADRSATANELGRRAAAYLDTLAHPARPMAHEGSQSKINAPIDLGPAIRAAARDRAIEALAAAIEATELPPPRAQLSDSTHELHITDPKRPG